MRAFAIALLVVGCGQKDKESNPKPVAGEASGTAAKPAKPIDCAERVAGLRTRLQELSRTRPGSLPLVQGITAPASTAARPLDARGFVIAVAADGALFVPGTRLAGANEVREYLWEMEKRAVEAFVMDGGSGRDAQWPVYIWADRGAPAKVVADVLTALTPPPDETKGGEGQYKMKKNPPDDATPGRYKMKKTPEVEAARQQAIEQARAAGILGALEGRKPRWLPRLVVTDAAAATSPLDAPATAGKLPASEPEAAEYLAGKLRASIGECKPIILGFANSTMAGTPDKSTSTLVEELSAGLQACECKLPDVALFEWGIQMHLGAWAPPLAWIDVPAIAPDATQPIGALVK